MKVILDNIENIPAYGILGTAGVICGIVYLWVITRKTGVDFNDVIYVYVWSAIGAMVGAKLLYILLEIPHITGVLRQYIALGSIGDGSITIKDYAVGLLRGGFVFDYILLDCPAGIEQGFKNAIAGADKALVVTTPEVSAIRDADRIIGLLEANDLRDIHLIINRLRPDMIARGDMMSVDDVTEILAVDLIGTLLDDEQIVIATNQGEPLSGKNSQAEEEYRNICKRLMGEEVPFAELRQKKGMFSRLFKRH